MNLKNKSKRKNIKKIRTLADYKEYADSLKIDDLDRKILDMTFIGHHDQQFIADELNYSKSTITKRFGKILDML